MIIITDFMVYSLFGMMIIIQVYSLFGDFTGLLSVWNDHNNILYGFTLCLE